MILTFDAAAHRYTMDGRIVPGTTEILRACGRLGDVESIPEQYRDRGTAVHLWIEALLKGRVTPSTPIPDVVRGYLDPFRAWWDLARPRLLGCEELVGDPVYRYATRIDLHLAMVGAEWTVNVKTGQLYPHYAEASALEARCVPRPVRRALLRLPGKGKAARFVELADRGDFLLAEQDLRRFRDLKRRGATAEKGETA